MKVIGAIVALVVVAAVVGWYLMRRPAGASFRGQLPPATGRQQGLATALRSDVEALTAQGSRNVFAPEVLRAAAAYIEGSFRASGYKVSRQTYDVEGVPCDNLEVEIRGATRPDEIVIIGAHYDSVDDSPGADDNASGVAALLAIAREVAKTRFDRTVRFVAFVNEEPPHFKTEQMGSLVYARRSHQRKEKIVAMLSLETIGYYDPREGSQRYPPPLSALYPSTADFIAFASNVGSRKLAAQCVTSFRRHVQFPAETASLPEVIQEIGWSDQWSFWQFGWPALMVTDTAPFRNPNYHRPSDLPHTLDYDRLSRVVEGLTGVVGDVASYGRARE
jgi:hypothetical protein